MTTIGPGIRPIAVQAKEKWLAGRQQLHEAHQAGADGLSTSRGLSALQDDVLLEIYQSALEEIGPELESNIAAVLLGGGGRQEIAPFSDVDLMLLYQGTVTEPLTLFSRRLSQDITDTGMQLGYSMRTVRDACSMSLEDAYIYSSLTEARFLAGNADLFANFQGRFSRIASRRTNDVIRAIVHARAQERTEFGETVYLLRPNIKKSRGGLRDIHLIRWLGYVQYGVTGIDQLLAAGGLSTADSTQLKLSLEFLLRVRNEMHFHADRAEDRLGRNEQVRLAEFFGFQEVDGMLAVELFMREYFRFSSRVGYICNHFVNKATTRRRGPLAMFESFGQTPIDEHFWIGPTKIGAHKSSLEKVQMDLEQVLRLMQLACLHDRTIEHETWIAIRHAMLKYPEIPFTSDAARRFMALLSNTKGLSESLYRLHEMQVLSKILPDFDHARGLLQFNEYHQFTVDEHSLRAVQAAIDFAGQDSTVGRAYDEIRDKNVLHLALLLHDLGKGFPEDHCDVGARIAQAMGYRLDLPDETIEDLKNLVQNHLVMSHLAFHRDISDPSLVAEFASNVGSIHLLTMLYVLTCADISAVGSNVLNPWKMSLLTDLYLHAKLILTGQEGSLATMLERNQRIYQAISLFGQTEEQQTQLLERAKSLPIGYCLNRPAEFIAEKLLQAQTLETNESLCWVKPVNEGPVFELCVIKGAHRRSGIFYRLTGLLSSFGLQIVAAIIRPIGDSQMFYWIQFEDPEFSETPPARLSEIERRARLVIQGLDDSPPRFRQTWKREESRATKLSRPKIEVKVNNQTVDHATIIDVFAYDKTGLLYKIVKKIYALGLDVIYSRVSTYAHQVIDVFYVTDAMGNKIRNKNQIQIIRRELLRSINEFLEEG
jgi:[protein-PII] uridylyltransferase